MKKKKKTFENVEKNDILVILGDVLFKIFTINPVFILVLYSRRIRGKARFQ